MSWQEELRRLDAELAEGRIEPADHRKQRDELLAQASGSTVPSPVPSPLRRPGEAWRSANPASHPAPAQYVPPPQRMESPRPAVPHQRPHQPPPPPWQRTGLPVSPATSHVPAIPDHMTTAPSPADITPTRYLSVDGPAERGPGSRFPPITPPGGESQPAQPLPGPEEVPGKHRWATDGEPSSERSWTSRPFIVLGALVVVGVVVGATMWLGKDDSKPNALATFTPVVTQPPAAAAQPQLEDEVPPLPGLQHPESSTMSLARGLDLKLYPKEAAQIFSQHGVTQFVYRASSAGDTGFLGYAIPAENEDGAKAIVDYLREAASAGGFVPVTADPGMVTGRNGDLRMNGTWYTSGKVAIVLWASQPFAKDKNELKTSLDNAVAVFKKALPPS
ncbi:hypothetical protein [Amycolatopsis vastitatis]|uniref:Uncharacterized protein n=1 Tax=Amycolatopsis vastitatis TaxID=1905142 RepID=A0A229TJR3_9PSEU|nr:hypothetical protein [Amycolatopsis vastitatis]OXM71240.1 hypothetical protein CF165_02015 [Amycolatopsis vastitatis]